MATIGMRSSLMRFFLLLRTWTYTLNAAHAKLMHEQNVFESIKDPRSRLCTVSYSSLPLLRSRALWIKTLTTDVSRAARKAAGSGRSGLRGETADIVHAFRGVAVMHKSIGSEWQGFGKTMRRGEETYSSAFVSTATSSMHRASWKSSEMSIKIKPEAYSL